MRAVTLISKSKPESQVTPTAVQLGYGANQRGLVGGRLAASGMDKLVGEA